MARAIRRNRTVSETSWTRTIAAPAAADAATAASEPGRRSTEEEFSATPENRRTLAVLAALSRQTSFSVGCYCADERKCHRSVLRALLRERGADVI